VIGRGERLVALAGIALLAAAPCARAAASPPCAPRHLNASQELAGTRVTVSPAPATRDSSAATQISILGVPAAQLSAVSVSGSRSGRHPGRLIAYSQGDGASFVPARPFADGERVTVRAVLSEAGRATPFAWSFYIAVRDHAGVALSSPRPAPHPSYEQHFRSRPDLRPPRVSVTVRSPSASPGDLFLAPYSGPGQYGPMILDENGALIWFKPLTPAGTRAADFRMQQYEGRSVLTWWQDPLRADGLDSAGGVIADSSYSTIAVVRAGNGYQSDLHEFQLTPQGTALITVYDGIDCDLRSAGGQRDAAVVDTLLQEIDVHTGLVRYEWHSLDHVPLSDSFASAKHSSRKTPFDYFHINSIDVEPDGQLLIDARNTWAAYDVDPRSGQVRWRLGGKRSSFTMGSGTGLAWQHDAREQPDGTITFFDNGATPAAHPQSRAVALRLEPARRAVTLVRRDVHAGAPLVAGSQGNVQALASGDWLVGWGEVPYLSEFAPGGQTLFDAHLPAPYESYRAYRLPWSGHPPGRPAVALSKTPAGSAAYVSWNGATDVSSWRVLSGDSAATLQPLREAQRSGFETAIALPGSIGGRYVAVQALDSAGAVIGVSAMVSR
jgi:Arylsulfotransferase (ASST)